MKKLLLLTAIALFGIAPKKTQAQINLNVNIGSQPLWGPVGYDHAEYYYLPDIETYYYVPERKFVSQSNGNWIYSSSLPVAYRSYDLYKGYKVVLNSPKPYLYFSNHKVKYKKYKGVHTQPVIIRSNNSKYYVVKGHPHGMPPGQAKKIMNGNGNSDKSHGNSGKSKGKGKN